MAFQFVHAKTYSVKTGGAGIASEAGRKPDHSRHVSEPKPPILLAGIEPEAAWSEIERRHGAARNTVKMKNGKTAQRKLRKDENILLAAVASHPTPTEQLNPDDPEFKAWIDSSLKFFEAQHGKPLSAVLHLDESHPHIHFLTAPDLEAGERMADIHPGEGAKRDAGGRKGKRTEKDHLYKEAMRKYQDTYHDQVGKRHGLTRLGPKRQRLARSEWKAQEAEAIRVAKNIRQLEDRDAKLDIRANKLDEKGSALRAEIARHNSRVANYKEKLKSHNEKHEKIISLIEERQKKLSDKEENVAKRERKAEEIIRENSNFYGRALSVMTFGSKGVEKEVRNARKAAREKAKEEIKNAQERLEKTKRIAAKRKLKIENLESDLSDTKDALKAKEQEVQILRNEVEGMQESLSIQRKESLPLEAEIATNAKNTRILSVKLDSLKASLEDLDIDQAKRIALEIDKQINVMDKPGKPEKPGNSNAAQNKVMDNNHKM